MIFAPGRAMTIRTGGEWVVEALRAAGARHVFGIPDVHNL
jgi:thiamine pyrophosphate-dependent acetolactate synthase large subunit-like protein